MNDYAFRLYSKRIQENGRVLEELAKEAVAKTKRPEELVEKVAALIKQANLQGEQVNRVCEMANVEMFRRMYDSEGDKTFAFPLVTQEKVAAINAPAPRRAFISKAAAIQEMATYIPGSENLDPSLAGMEKAAACKSHGGMKKKKAKKAYTEKDIIKYKSIARRNKKKAAEAAMPKMSELSPETEARSIEWFDNGLRDILQLANDAMERVSLEKEAALADVGRIGAYYLRDGATLYDVVNILGEREITKEATVRVIDYAEKVGGIRWEKGDVAEDIADPYGLVDAMDKYAEACWEEENLTKLAGLVIDARIELATTRAGMEKTAASPSGWAKAGGRLWGGIKSLLFGSAKRAPQEGAKGWEAFKQARQNPHVGWFSNVEKAKRGVSKEEYKRIKKVYGKKYVGKMRDTADPKNVEYKAVAPRFGGVLGSLRKHPLLWLSGGLMAPSAYQGLKQKLAENKAQATAGLGNYQPQYYGSY